MTKQSNRCGAQRKDGQACRRWAVRGSQPPRCADHRGDRPGPATEPAPEQVSSQQERQPGALEGEVEGDQVVTLDFYGRSYSMEEVADLMAAAMDEDLMDEVSAARIVVRRALEHLEKELSPAEYARMVNLIFRGTSTIARLMRAQRQLSKEAAKEFAMEMEEALDEIGGERGIDL